MLCFLETPVLRFNLLPSYRWNKSPLFSLVSSEKNISGITFVALLIKAHHITTCNHQNLKKYQTRPAQNLQKSLKSLINLFCYSQSIKLTTQSWSSKIVKAQTEFFKIRQPTLSVDKTFMQQLVPHEGLNPFHATALFLYPLKTMENQRFSDVFREHRKKPAAWNGLLQDKIKGFITIVVEVKFH